jgi:hypothetical protein
VGMSLPKKPCLAYRTMRDLLDEAEPFSFTFSLSSGAVPFGERAEHRLVAAPCRHDEHATAVLADNVAGPGQELSAGKGIAAHGRKIGIATPAETHTHDVIAREVAMRVGDLECLGTQAVAADLHEHLRLHVIDDHPAIIGRQVRVWIGGGDRRRRLAACRGQRQRGAANKCSQWCPPSCFDPAAFVGRFASR